ncbi:hypothetical protein WJX75_004054 [Coccomyxa subellipsoidea]|uniref:TPR-like protein n=1 Tax=Coccomyxa subellipsoidea TaxID=248742 RepID=A0ABR2YF28_9CHLO
MEALLIGLPLVLPLLALYASRRRESLKLQADLNVIRNSWSYYSQQLDQHEEEKVRKLQQAFQVWREDLQKQLPSGKLKSIESKLAALEGSVLSAGRSAQSAARNVEVASSSMAETTALQMKELGARLARDLQQDLQAKSVAPTEDPTNLVPRLEAIESSLQGLEEGQVQGMRRLAQGIMGAVEEAEASLQSTLQADARRSFDALQRLPALLAAALPVTDVTPLQTLAGRAQPPALAQIAPADRAWLQGVLENALQLAAERVLEKQQDRAGAALPAMLADEQWDALGKRLRGIEQSVQDLLEGTGGEDVPAREEALVTEVAALRNDMSTALKGLREADGVANPEFAPLLSSINDSLEALRSQVGAPLPREKSSDEQGRSLSGALQPIQAALAELQSSQASLQRALQSTSEASSGTSLSTESVEEAARRAAKEVLREFSAQTPDVVELRETIGATLAAVRQLETATMERITSLAASMQSLPTGSSSTDASSSFTTDAPPKGTGTQQTPEEQAQAGGSQFQDIERERQRGSSGDDTGTYAGSQQFLSNGVSAREPADRNREPFAPGEGYQAAAPSATNGTSGSAEEAGDREEQLEALVQEGKQLLREGRQLTKTGFDLGGADLALQDAMACFEEAAQIDSTSIKVQGNWGNALMAYGVLKKRYLSELRDAPPPQSYEERAAARAAEDQLTDEAEAALVAAGQKFRAVAERDQDDTRALGNWGRALCVRAELARDPEVACALYEAAIAKFEAVLEADPGNRPVLRNCALALFDLARLQPDPTSRAARQLLEDAARYLEDVLTINGGDEDAAIALDQCFAELDQLRTVRR